MLRDWIRIPAIEPWAGTKRKPIWGRAADCQHCVVRERAAAGEHFLSESRMRGTVKDEFAYWTIAEAAAQLRRRKISPVELAEAALARIESLNPRLNAFITVTAERALREARAGEREMRRRKFRGLLHGIPLTLKDNVWTSGVRTTVGSKILKDFVPSVDARVAQKLSDAGAVLVGKTNLHEFAYGITTENPHYGPTRNPWNTDCIPGGSSGGSAAALAAGIGFASVGTDTGGSIRIPAALCGIVGLKPTFGLVSCEGVIPLAVTLDHAGPLTRCVADAAIMLDAICERDARTPRFYRELMAAGKKRARKTFRLGWPGDYFFERVDDEVKNALDVAARQFEKLGASIEEIALPNIGDSVEPSTQIALAEALEYQDRKS